MPFVQNRELGNPRRVNIESVKNYSIVLLNFIASESIATINIIDVSIRKNN